MTMMAKKVDAAAAADHGNNADYANNGTSGHGHHHHGHHADDDHCKSMNILILLAMNIWRGGDTETGGDRYADAEFKTWDDDDDDDDVVDVNHHFYCSDRDGDFLSGAWAQHHGAISDTINNPHTLNAQEIHTSQRMLNEFPHRMIEFNMQEK